MPPLTDPTMSTPSIVLNAHFSPRANPHGCAFLVNLVLIVKPECCRARQTNPPAARPGTRQAASQTARPAALQATRQATSPVPEPAVTPRGGGHQMSGTFQNGNRVSGDFFARGNFGEGGIPSRTHRVETESLVRSLRARVSTGGGTPLSRYFHGVPLCRSATSRRWVSGWALDKVNGEP